MNNLLKMVPVALLDFSEDTNELFQQSVALGRQ